MIYASFDSEKTKEYIYASFVLERERKKKRHLCLTKKKKTEKKSSILCVWENKRKHFGNFYWMWPIEALALCIFCQSQVHSVCPVLVLASAQLTNEAARNSIAKPTQPSAIRCKPFFVMLPCNYFMHGNTTRVKHSALSFLLPCISKRTTIGVAKKKGLVLARSLQFMTKVTT